MSLDMQKVKSLPIQKSLLLINNFVINTTKFLNAFSETCEKKISQVSSKATGLEIMLAVLEAKLNSIPDLEVMSSPQAAPSSSSQEQAQQPALFTDASPASAPQTTASSSSAAELEPTQHMGNLVKDDPAYEPFFKMLKVGVPMPVVQMKCSAAGLDSSLLENPDAAVSVHGSAVASAPTPTSVSASQNESSEDQDTPPVDVSAPLSVAEGVKACEHPDYAPFFKMLRVGVPMPVVQMKCSAAGLDGSLLEDPDAMVA